MIHRFPDSTITMSNMNRKEMKAKICQICWQGGMPPHHPPMNPVMMPTRKGEIIGKMEALLDEAEQIENPARQLREKLQELGKERLKAQTVPILRADLREVAKLMGKMKHENEPTIPRTKGLRVEYLTQHCHAKRFIGDFQEMMDNMMLADMQKEIKEHWEEQCVLAQELKVNIIKKENGHSTDEEDPEEEEEDLEPTPEDEFGDITAEGTKEVEMQDVWTPLNQDTKEKAMKKATSKWRAQPKMQSKGYPSSSSTGATRP
jgi:hypothetical protein